MTAPFSVLHVCIGNICRSPMAERLLMSAVVGVVGVEAATTLVYSHSAGTGSWHMGERMNPPAANQLRQRGAVDTGFRARKLLGEHVDASDLVLTASAEQVDYVLALRADAAPRTFVLGEFGRLLVAIDLDSLPPAATDPAAMYARGVALVELVNKARGGNGPRPQDDLDDPWGENEAYFSRVADEIEATVRPLAAALVARGA